MSVILILIIASVLMATLFVCGFIWSVCSGQYEDTTTPSMRVLVDEESRKERASEMTECDQTTEASNDFLNL